MIAQPTERYEYHEREILLEKEAVARFEDAIATIKADLGWYWRWGDGEGGYVLDALENAVKDAGHRWPFDPRGPSSIKTKQKIPGSLRVQVMERDEYRCVTCNSHKDLACDHIIPESKGGPTTFENLQTMCRPCNSRKGNRV